MNPAIETDDVETVMVLENSDVFQRVAINQYAVGVIAFLDLAELVASHHECCDASCCCYNRLMLGESKQPVEMFEISGICSVRCPRKSVVTRSRVSLMASIGLRVKELY